MPKPLGVIIEWTVLICALWVICFLSTLLHEMGHALGYWIATGGRQWHIRIGSGKRLLKTGRLTVKLLPIDGCFSPSETSRMDTTAKLIAMLAGGPAASLLLVAVLLAIRLGGVSLHSELIASDAIEFFVRSALFINLFTLILALMPTHYFHGEIKGMETDGLQILHAIKNHRRKL